MPRTLGRVLQPMAWLASAILLTAILLAFQHALDKTHIVLAYLLLVLGGSVAAGRSTGLALAVISFGLFDWYFLPPRNTLGVTNPIDWLVLAAYFAVSVVAAQLVHRLQMEAERARSRTADAERLEGAARHAEALRETNRLKNALLASVSHDLRTPLTTIKAVAHELVRVDGRAAIIEEEADRLNRMVRDLLDLSRVHSGSTLATVEVTPVDDLVGAALQRISGAIPSRAIDVTLQDGGTLLVGHFDLAASVRILVNLIENANKYAPANAAILLSAMQRGAWIELTVSDTGPGVATSERERIFEPFYRPANAPADGGSAGLGLAIARGLAEAQNGSLCYADRPGGGATFTLSLPAATLPGYVAGS